MRCTLRPHPLGLGRAPQRRPIAPVLKTARARPLKPSSPPKALGAAVEYQTDGKEPITLPLNFYSLLHVNRASSREAVKRAYEKIINSPPDVGYSQDTLFSRAVLLKSAAECLADLDARRAYDAAAAAGGGAHTFDVSRDNLPGALVLLQEAGESQLVLHLGCEWLDAHQATGGEASQAADVAASVALALCDLAAAALEGESGQVAGACERLEEALALLRRHGLAPQLQQQIGDTLEVGAEGSGRCEGGAPLLHLLVGCGPASALPSVGLTGAKSDAVTSLRPPTHPDHTPPPSLHAGLCPPLLPGAAGAAPAQRRRLRTAPRARPGTGAPPAVVRQRPPRARGSEGGFRGLHAQPYHGRRAGEGARRVGFAVWGENEDCVGGSGGASASSSSSGSCTQVLPIPLP